MPIDRDALRLWVEASCAAQGVQVQVTDPGVVAQVEALTGGRGAARRLPQGAQRGTRSVTVATSELSAQG